MHEKQIILYFLGRASLQQMLANNQIDALFRVFIYSSHLYMFRASSAHHQEIELY